MSDTNPPLPQRISVQGISGSGKTTLGRLLERRMRIPHLETDAVVHGPGWTETPGPRARALIEPLVLSERWVIDGDYRRKLGTWVLEHADTVVWLDLPLRVCLRRLWTRTRRRMKGHEEVMERQHGILADRFWQPGFAVRVCRPQALRSSAASWANCSSVPELGHLRLVRLRSRRRGGSLGG